MRIVAGVHRGRPLRGTKTGDVRPTSDRARQAIFDVLAHGAAAVEIEGAAVADVFAGSGALGLEALSRGAAHAVFIDSSGEAIAAVRANAARLREWRKATLLKLDATCLPPPPLAAKAPAALAFLDPPYQSGLAPLALYGLARHGWIAEGAVVVVEVAKREPFEPPAGFRVLDERVYGAARVVFLRYAP
jgi:16S rRNA (guanine966-N2)-methyltransferase